MSRPDKFGAVLKPADVLGVALVFPMLLLLDVMLTVFGVVRVQRWLAEVASARRARRRVPGDPRLDPRLQSLVTAVDRAGRRYRANGRCLRRSLVVWTWLTVRGVESDVILGVRQTADGLMGHAWVEWQGIAIYEPSELASEAVSFVVMGKEPLP